MKNKIYEYLRDQKCKKLLCSYLTWTALTGIITLLIASVQKINNWHGIIALICVSIGLGEYNIQTWGGVSPAENLKSWIQKLLGLLTLIFGLLSLD